MTLSAIKSRRGGGRAFRAALVSGAASLPLCVSAAFAQQGAPADEIVVTGSRISRGALDAPQPLQQFSGEDVINSGEANLIDFLADIPALQGSVVPEDTTGAGLGDGGLSLLNLRNLGVDRTLVLVNGRRHVGASPGTAAVDVDSIPRLLIKNVDVVTGASSAVYGSDAVSGVVNFVLDEEFDGVELDVAGASINQGLEDFNYRFSGLIGKNLLDDRLNVYLSAEYEEGDEVLERDLSPFLNDALLFNVDVDPAGNPVDGVTDNILLAGNLTSISRPTGGILTLAHDIRQNGITDGINIPFVSCAPASLTSGNCFIIDPGFSFQFAPGGASVLPNFGTFRDPTGTLRTIVQNGSGDVLSSFRDSRLPENDALRFQAGASFKLTPNIKAFVEGKYVRENVLDSFQPAFFDVQLLPIAAGAPAPGLTALTAFAIGNVNPFLPANVQAAILGNTRTTFASTAVNAAPTGTVADPRAQIRVFTTDFGGRPQDLQRETLRFVGGFKGDAEKALFFNNFNWEIGYTYGEVKDRNDEIGTIDVERLQNAVDAVTDTAGLVNGVAGQTVCRVQLLAAQGVAGFDPTDPNIAGCIPGSLFGQGGLTPTIPYVLTSIGRTNENRQHDVLAFASGELFDLWGAGPIGVAFGGEYRRESAQGTVEFQDTDPRVLFANTGSDFAKRDFDVTEGFFEAAIPLLSDLPMIKKLEAGGAVRVSDYSTIGTVTTWNANGLWEINDSLKLRGTYGTAVRAPNLDELFAPASQTFIQINDPCSQPIINATADPVIQANRIANCALLGVPASYVDPNPGTSNPGNNAGNPFLLEERSRSYTASLIWTPRQIENFSLVVDFFNIRIQDAIAAAGIQSVVNLCVDGNVPNTPFCNTFSRDPGTFEITDFIQGAVNFSSIETRGIDFAARYSFDLASGWWAKDGAIPGSLTFNARGTYLLRRNDFANIVDPTDATELDGNLVGGTNYPRVRFLFTTAWEYKNLRLSHDLDFQTSTEINESNAFLVNTDSGLEPFSETGRFAQHDLTAVYTINDNFTVRAGVVNLFDKEPPVQVGFVDDFDLFGRRYFIGAGASF
ncbi:MAG TPA: TonB-dependent receptor [Parvularcula sp.]|nr:TonB-dependent receptor [Parvularcula sp.]HBS32557.1 TonB-dependent receptor [Parvularcula sp.]